MIANCNWIGRHYNNEALIFALHHICAAQAHTYTGTAVNHMIAFDMPVNWCISIATRTYSAVIKQEFASLISSWSATFWSRFWARRACDCWEMFECVCVWVVFLCSTFSKRSETRELHPSVLSNESDTVAQKTEHIGTHLPASAAIRIAFVFEVGHILYHPLVDLAER